MIYTLPKLNYGFDALEPHIDATTMEIHYGKHHQAYVDNLNKVMEKYPDLADRPLGELMRDFDSLEMDEKDKTMFRNNGGGHLNHTFFWSIMGPEKRVDEKLIQEITGKYGSVDAFKQELEKAAMARFGSGWAWLVRKQNGELDLYSTPNQDSPLMDGDAPVIGVDVWEHAYYLKYQNRRAEYLKHWWNTLTLLP